MDQPSEKKPRKTSRDTDSKKKSSSTTQRQEHSHPASSSHASSSSHPINSSDPGIQRKHHWQTVMQPPTSTSASSTHRTPKSNFKTTSANSRLSLTPPSGQNTAKSSSSLAKRRQPSSSAPLRPVKIAPSGPITGPREDYDGYRFKCPEEGCQQRFRHRSSRSRHKRNCPMKKEQEKI